MYQSVDKEPTLSIQKPIYKPRPKPKPIQKPKPKSNMLRGVILSQHYSNSRRLWLYRFKVIDIVNDSLQNIKFFYKRRVLQAGDLVYVVFNGSQRDIARDIILIKKSYKKYKKTPNKILTKKSNKFHKRTKARQAPGIGLPKSNTINLK